MLPADIDAELGWLRDQALSSQDWRRRQDMHWRRCGLVALCVAFMLGVISVALAAAYGVNPTPTICTILTFASVQSLALGIALGAAGGRGASIQSLPERGKTQ